MSTYTTNWDGAVCRLRFLCFKTRLSVYRFFLTVFGGAASTRCFAQRAF